MLYKKNWGEKNMHIIWTDFGFNLLRSASKLKRGVIVGIGGLIWFSVFVNFLSPIFVVVFILPWIVMGTLSVNRFQSNLFYILHDIRLSSTFLWAIFFNVVFLSLFFVFFSQPDVNITWITGHIHRSIVDRIDQTITGADPGFQARGGGAHLKKFRRMEGGANIFWVFRVKNHDFTPKNLIFSNFRGGACRVRPPWIRPLYSEYVEMVKLTLSITLGYIFLWNVIRRIYLPCLQLISKKYFWWTVMRTLPPSF
jgi:hypothetical protein